MYIMLWALGLLGPNYFTCTAHLCLLYKALMYIFSLRNTIQSSSISNKPKWAFSGGFGQPQ